MRRRPRRRREKALAVATSAIVDVPASHARGRQVETELLRERLLPPPELSVSEWADTSRHLSSEASAEPGQWRTDRAPYLREILDSFSDDTVEHIVVMSSAQIGKTETILNVIGYHIDQDPAPVLVLQPTVEMGHAFSKDRLAPMLRDSPALHGRIAPVKSRDSGNTILHKKFAGGHVTIAGANSAASLASRPIRTVLADEVDRFPASAGSEGDPVALARKRTANYPNRKIGEFSTPTLKGLSRIEESFGQGDQRRFFVPCPSCGHRQELKWANMKWEHRDPATARYVCDGCGELLEESAKVDMLLGGEWVAEYPGRRIRSFHISALYSPWTLWEDLVAEFIEAKGNPERLRVFVNTVLGETWEEAGDRLETPLLLARREKYEAVVPDGVGILTAAIDVQGDRLEFLVRGWGAGEESWLIHWEQIWGDPGQELVWANALELLNRRYKHASGAELVVQACAVDSGGHHTERVYRFVKPLQQRRIHAIKGIGGEGRPLLGRPSRANKWGVRLMPVGVDTAKDVLFSRLRITEPAPGYMHFPEWLDEEYFAQLTAEKVVTRYHMGRPRRRYEKTRPRNEALDLEVYALAALTMLGPAIVNHLGIWAERARGGSPAEPEDEAPGGRRGHPKKRRGFAENF